MADRRVRPSTLVGVDRSGLYKMFAEKGFTKGCEVGVREGGNAQRIINAIPDVHLILVDPYLFYRRRTGSQERMDKYRRRAMRRLAACDVTWMMLPSREASCGVRDESLDFVYIDGNHKFECVADDINAWFPKVRTGGIVSGHDYSMESVRDAVDGFVRHNKIRLTITDRDAERKGYCSWMFEK